MIIDTQNIRDLKQWLCWRAETREGKPTKIPYSPNTRARASSTDPETWGTYQEAVAAYKKYGYGGIGFVFTPENDLCGIDLDGCLDPQTGQLEGWTQEIIDELDSYTEISPSGTGVHVLVKGTLPPGRNRKGRFEAYDQGRYFTVTGRHPARTPQSIENRQEQLERVIRRIFGEMGNTNGHRVLNSGLVSELSDEQIIEKASSANNGDKFRPLWVGEIVDY